MIDTVNRIINHFEKDPTRLMDILIETQSELGVISDEAIAQISHETGLSKVDVEQTISFYHFFSQNEPVSFQYI